MMNCPRVAALVTDFLEGTMSALNRARFEFHIWWCKDCRQHVDKMGDLVDALGTIPPEDIPEHLKSLIPESPTEE